SFNEFNVNNGQRVYFADPAAIENILTRVTGENGSLIDGVLGVDGLANLYFLNPNGVIFGPNARLDVPGSFVTSTGNSFSFADGSEFSALSSAGESLTVSVPLGVQFNDSPNGDITQTGTLAVDPGQTLTLFGDTVEHSGSLMAPGGTVQLLGNRVALTETASVDASSAMGGGTVLIGGDYKGEGTVPNAQQTRVEPGATITANALENGDGGTVIVWADGVTQFGGSIAAQGGPLGGDGGFIETSGAQQLAVGNTAQVNTQAPNGNGGTWLLDPTDLEVVAAGGTATLVGNTNSPAAASTINAGIIETPLLAGTNVTLQADNSITINAPITAIVAGFGDLTLNAPVLNLNQDVDIGLTAADGDSDGLFGTATEINVGASGQAGDAFMVARSVTAPVTINLAAATYTEDFAVGSESSQITVNGAGVGATVIPDYALETVNFNNPDLVFNNLTLELAFSDAGLTLNNTVVNDNATALGSDISVLNSTVNGLVFGAGSTTIRNSTVNDSVFISGGNNTIENSTIDGSTSISGLPGISSSGGTLTVSDTTVTNFSNTAGEGGGIAVTGGTVTLNNVTVSNNTALGSGGGLYVTNGATAITINGGSFSNNTAQGANGNDAADANAAGGGGGGGAGLGGGIYSEANNISITGTTFSNNQAIGGNGGRPGGFLVAGISDGAAGGGANGGAGGANGGGGAGGAGAAGGFGGGGGGGGAGFGVGGAGGAGGFGGGGGGGGQLGVGDQRGIGGFGGGTGGSLNSGNGGAGGGGAGLGGAIFIQSGTASLSGTTLASNSAQGGNGINDIGAGVNSGGGSGFGGSIFVNTAGAVNVSSGVFNGNSATPGTGTNLTINLPVGSGGGIYALGTLGTIQSSSFSQNTAGDDGGAIYNSEPLALSSSTFSQNTSGDDGGAIYNDGTLTLSTSTFTQNTSSSSGGAIYNIGPLDVSTSTFSSNTASSIGGAIYNIRDLTISDSTFSANTAFEGGGIYNDNTTNVTSSTFSANAADNGGGIYNFDDLTVSSSTFSANTATSGDGGGIFNDGTTNLGNSTLSSNTASAGRGGGIFSTFDTLEITSSLVLNNTASDGANLFDDGSPFVSGGSNLFGASGDAGVSGATIATTEIATVPVSQILDITLANYGGLTPTLSLVPGSPAIDAGSGIDPDQRGVAVVNGVRDIGAFESQGYTLTITSGERQATVINQEFPNPLVVTVSSAFGESVSGGQVIFTAPISGASALLSSNSPILDANAQASVTATANGITGIYSVLAEVNPTAEFRLVNLFSLPDPSGFIIARATGGELEIPVDDSDILFNLGQDPVGVTGPLALTLSEGELIALQSACSPGGGEGSGALVFTGSGGLPPGPNNPQVDDAIDIPWVEPDAGPAAPIAPTEADQSDTLIDSQVMVVDDDGAVHFVASATPQTLQSFGVSGAELCRAISSP
ncbi:MAG: filamentous hemagglutinin N-terminal domain-containing protein, partial [Cyanobacteria bacterium P01_C01_bin.147]